MIGIVTSSSRYASEWKNLISRTSEKKQCNPQLLDVVELLRRYTTNSASRPGSTLGSASQWHQNDKCCSKESNQLQEYNTAGQFTVRAIWYVGGHDECILAHHKHKKVLSDYQFNLGALQCPMKCKH